MELSKDMQPGSSFTDRQFITTLTDISLFSSYIAPIGNTEEHTTAAFTQVSEPGSFQNWVPILCQLGNSSEKCDHPEPMPKMI